jgi:hypothetical protein
MLSIMYHMNVFKILKYSLVLTLLMGLTSCRKEKNEDLKIDGLVADKFLFNIPVVGDTIFIDSSNGMDFRVAFEGYNIHLVKVDLAGYKQFVFDSIVNFECIMNSEPLLFGKGVFRISFLIKATVPGGTDTINIKSKNLVLNILDNVSDRFVIQNVVDGKLKITWPRLDKKHEQSYLLERLVGENPAYGQLIETIDSAFTDPYYVGEKVTYRISMINKDGRKQRTWNFVKQKESPSFIVAQRSDKGYMVNFSSCRYYNNFGEYIVTTEDEINPPVLFRSSSLYDTSYYAFDAKFGEEKILKLICLPKVYPNGVTNLDWHLYSNPMYVRYYKNCFRYERLVAFDQKNFLYTSAGHIYKFNIESNSNTDAIINTIADYGFLRITPGSKYFYAVDENIYDSPIYIWSAEGKFSSTPKYVFQINFYIPLVSDNLLTLIRLRSATSASKLAIFDITTGHNLYTTPYDATGDISPDGQFMLIEDLNLKLCSFINGIFKVEWELPTARFYAFHPFDTKICIIWDNTKILSIRNISDGSILYSFSLDIESIINIDFFNSRILGYVNGKFMIFNLENGALLKEINADSHNLLLSGYSSVLFGNTIYSNNERKYDISF